MTTTTLNKDMQRFLNNNLKQLPVEPGKCLQGTTYVASPYWHPDPTLRKQRRQIALHMAIQLIDQGVIAFSPVIYTSDIQEGGGQGDNWYDFDLNFLETAQQMVVLRVEGWLESKGVMLEIGYARGRGIPIYYMDP